MRDLLEIFQFAGGAVNVTAFTADTNATLLVPAAGHHLEIYSIVVNAPDGSTVQATFSDG